MAINFLSSINLNKNQLIKAAIENQPGDIAAGAGVEGQVYFDTSTSVKVLKVWNGTGWVEVGGGVLTVTSGNTDTITIGGTTANPTVAANTAAVSDGSPNLVTGNQVYDFVTGIGYVESVDVNGSTFITVTDGGTSADPTFAVSLAATGSPSATTYLRGDNSWATLPGPATITLTGDVTGSGTTSIATTIASGAVEFSMMDPIAIVTSGEGIPSNDNDVTLPTSAAVKAYVDASVAGGLIYQGGYDAATNTPNLDSPPTIAGIKRGWTYTVTVEGTFFTEQVRVGDVLIAEIDTPTTLADWTTVQNNIDLASLTQVGIGNVNAGTGIGVSYTSGTATVTNTDLGSSQNIFKNIAVAGQSTIVADSNNDTLTLAAGTGITLTTDDTTDTVTITAPQAGRSFTNTGPSPSASTTYTIDSTTHGLGTDSSVIMVQLVQVSTGETIYSDVTRGASGLITITFAASQTANSIRALLQKIG
jgi:hypothetical protein